MFTGLNLNRLVALAVALVLVIGGAALGIRMYGNSRVAAQELGTVKEAVQEAVERRDERVQRDVSTKAQRAATGRETRSAVKRTEESLANLKASSDANLKAESRTGLVLSPDERRLWNDLIRDANRSITAP